MQIYNRILEQYIKPLLFNGKVLLIIGARQVGKTTMLKTLSESLEKTLWLNADQFNIREQLTNPTIEGIQRIIGNYKVVVIDEIQRIQNAGLLLKLLVDNFNEVQFIATGSSSLEISETVFEPLTGRYFIFHLFPFSMKELYPELSQFELQEKLEFHLVYGNYPEVVIKNNISELILRNLSQQYLYKDVLVWKDIRKPELLDKLLRLLSYQVCSEVSINELANTLKVKSETVETYIDLLEKSFVIYRLSAFSTNHRNEISKMNKILFWDNGIRNAVIEDYNDLKNRSDQGQLFENFIIGERIKMNYWTNASAKSYFWRNYNQSEVDYIESVKNKLLAIEIKWNTNKKNYISKAFLNLYPDSQSKVISPDNFLDFVFLQ
ncbi:MAG: ATP-binding protein [Saprospiraceae bacterium]